MTAAANSAVRQDLSAAAHPTRAARLCLVVHDDLELRLRLAALVRRAVATLDADAMSVSSLENLSVEQLRSYRAVLLIVEFMQRSGGSDPLAALIRLRTRSGIGRRGPSSSCYDIDRDEAAFLEVNTRLQVEHRVTESRSSASTWWNGWCGWRGRRIHAVMARAGCRRTRGAPSRRASTPRTRRRTSGPAPGCSPRWPSADARGRRVDRDGHRGDRRTTTRCWPRSSPRARPRDGARPRWLRALADSRVCRHRDQLRALRAALADPVVPSRRDHTTADAGRRADPAPASTCSRRARRPRCRTGRAGSATGMSACRRRARWTTARFRLGNRALGNPEGAAGLEITLRGPDAALQRRD